MEDSINEAKRFICQILIKDISTLKHSLDVYILVKRFYNELPVNLKARLDKENLLAAALLHDVGKLTIPDEILKKPDVLNPCEKDIIKNHVFYGKKILERSEYSQVSDWVLYHHERADGCGYYGLTTEQTPLESKIIAIADTYSAITMKRVYRKRSSGKQAVKVLKSVSGTQLDEFLVKIFCAMVEKDKAFGRVFEFYKLLVPMLYFS